jgi:putative ABC transport system permease protein
MRQFFLEAVIVALVSGGAGLLVAFGLCALVNLLPMPEFFAGLLPTWQTGMVAMAVLGTIAILSAVYPARRAAAIDPIEALRHEAGG